MRSKIQSECRSVNMFWLENKNRHLINKPVWEIKYNYETKHKAPERNARRRLL